MKGPPLAETIFSSLLSDPKSGTTFLSYSSCDGAKPDLYTPLQMFGRTQELKESILSRRCVGYRSIEAFDSGIRSLNADGSQRSSSRLSCVSF